MAGTNVSDERIDAALKLIARWREDPIEQVTQVWLDELETALTGKPVDNGPIAQ